MAKPHHHLSDDQKKELMVKIVSQAWVDPDFKKRLFSHPRAVLTEMNFPFPANKEVRIVEEGQKYKSDENIVTLIFPKHPHGYKNMSEKELKTAAGHCTSKLSEKELAALSGGVEIAFGFTL
jgi:hypothetical protein